MSEAEESILSKGPKYATTAHIKDMNIVAQMEAALRFSVASEEAKDLLRIKVSEAIRNARRPKNNIGTAERQAFKELRNWDDIKILQADKGKATVIMNTGDCNRKVHNLLNDRLGMTFFRETKPKQQSVTFSSY